MSGSLMIITGCFIYTCIISCQPVDWLSGSESDRSWTKQGNHHQGNNQLCLLQLPTVSGYISTAVLPFNLLANFNFLYALFCWPRG